MKIYPVNFLLFVSALVIVYRFTMVLGEDENPYFFEFEKGDRNFRGDVGPKICMPHRTPPRCFFVRCTCISQKI